MFTKPYVRTFQREIEAALGTRLQVKNFGHVFGLWTRELLGEVENDPKIRDAVSRSLVVTFNIGENDVLRSLAAYEKGDKEAIDKALQEFQVTYPKLVDTLLDLVPPGKAIVRTFTIYNAFPDHPLRRYLRGYNRVILNTCARGRNRHRRKIPVARVDRIFAKEPLRELLGFDGMHPSYRGHCRMGEALAALGTSPV